MNSIFIIVTLSILVGVTGAVLRHFGGLGSALTVAATCLSGPAAEPPPKDVPSMWSDPHSHRLFVWSRTAWIAGNVAAAAAVGACVPTIAAASTPDALLGVVVPPMAAILWIGGGVVIILSLILSRVAVRRCEPGALCGEPWLMRWCGYIAGEFPLLALVATAVWGGVLGVVVAAVMTLLATIHVAVYLAMFGMHKLLVRRGTYATTAIASPRFPVRRLIEAAVGVAVLLLAAHRTSSVATIEYSIRFAAGLLPVVLTFVFVMRVLSAAIGAYRRTQFQPAADARETFHAAVMDYLAELDSYTDRDEMKAWLKLNESRTAMRAGLPPSPAVFPVGAPATGGR